MKHFKYKKKSTPKAFVTVSKSKYETEELEHLSFGTGADVISYIDSIDYHMGKKDTAQMLNDKCSNSSVSYLDLDTVTKALGVDFFLYLKCFIADVNIPSIVLTSSS